MPRAAMTSAWQALPHPVRWITVAVVGGTLVLVGLLLLVLPGPGIPVLALGLLILATEFAWAKATLGHVTRHTSNVTSKVSSRFRRRGESS